MNPAVPEPAARIVRRAMSPSPDQRYASAEEMLADLEAVLAPPSPPRRGRTATALRTAAGVLGTAVALVAVAGLLAVAMVGFQFWPIPPTPPPSDPAEEATRPPPPKLDTWEQLFDGDDLAGWQPVPFDPPDKTPGNFSVVEVNRLPAVRASGEGQVAIETEREFEDFHLRFEYRWGAAAGLHLASVRYHCTGPVGAKGTHGMELHLNQAGSYLRKNDLLRFDLADLRGGKVVPTGPAGQGVPPWSNRELPLGKWNQAALVCVGDSAVHVLNGAPVLALARSRRPGDPADVPVTRGRVRLQSVKGEVLFRKIEVRRATEIPAEYLADKPAPPAGGREPQTPAPADRPRD